MLRNSNFGKITILGGVPGVRTLAFFFLLAVIERQKSGLNSFWSLPGKKFLKRRQSCKLRRLFVYRCSERETSQLEKLEEK